MATGNKFHVVCLSPEYGERRYAVEDLSITRDNLVREWRKKGPGRTTVEGISKPKKGLIWRGTEEEATKLCEALNTSNKLGSMTVASDPPTRHNAVAFSKERNARSTSSSKSFSSSPSFEKCDGCGRMVKKGHTCPST